MTAAQLTDTRNGLKSTNNFSFR
uniref:Uncharacterized protein n=1 Tax=Anguilla anguilla TaxID=7936 RepID=A0A0E9SU64_ANGAN